MWGAQALLEVAIVSWSGAGVNLMHLEMFPATPASRIYLRLPRDPGKFVGTPRTPGMVGCLPAQLLGCVSPWLPRPASRRLLGFEQCLAGEAAAQKDLPPELRARVIAQRVVRTDERTVVLSVLVRECRGTAESDLPVPARLRITHMRSGSSSNDASSLEREARLIPQVKRQVESKG